MISKQYKYVVVHGEIATYLKLQPKKVYGGFMDKNGHRWIGSNVELMDRHVFETQRPW